jgi:hypothetical protein
MPGDFPDWKVVEARIVAQPRLRLAYQDAGMRAYELAEWSP